MLKRAYRAVKEFFGDIVYSIRSKIRYHKKMKEIRKRDPYIYK